jgi:hypothetical protein
MTLKYLMPEVPDEPEVPLVPEVPLIPDDLNLRYQNYLKYH